MRPYSNWGRWLLPGLLLLAVLPAAIGWAAIAAVTAVPALAAVTRRLLAWRAGRRALAGRGGGILLGADTRGRPVVLSDEQLSAHGLIVGASGSGKSTTMLALLTEHITSGRPVVAIDMKGSPDFARRLEVAARLAGRPFVVWTPDGPAHWNPLRHGNPTELKDKLISTERFTEPHYQRAAERYAQLALGVLAALHPGRPPTLDEVVDAMDPRRLSVLSRGLPPGRSNRVQDYLAALTADQLSAVRGLATRLAIVTESHTGRFLAPSGPADPGTGPSADPGTGPSADPGPGPEVDLRAALEGDAVVVFSLNSSRYGQLAAQLGTLAIQDLITATGDRQERVESPRPGERIPQQALVGIDEFSALGNDNVLALLARGRAAGVSVLLATQEFADLDRAGRGLADQISGITAIKIAHRQDVHASAQTVSQMAGTKRVWESSYQLASGMSAGFGRHGDRETRREVERPIIHPNTIKTLKTGQAVVISKLPEASARTIRVAPPRDERQGSTRDERRGLTREERQGSTPEERQGSTRAERRGLTPSERTGGARGAELG